VSRRKSRSFSNRYAEKQVATCMSKGGGVVEVFAARDGSWTMIVTMPFGYACLWPLVRIGKISQCLPKAQKSNFGFSLVHYIST
ncbi:MAG: hypothetical protein QF493_13315, partial [Rhodospirillales bacterium]|nr:hypothetical protein [Rhodospirillales bacterium]